MIDRGLGFRDIEELLRRIGDAAERVVVVGGQAVNFWAGQYEDRVAELKAAGPFTSKDFDLCAGTRELQIVAERLEGTPYLAGFDETTSQVGKIIYVDRAGIKRVIDVMTSLIGLDHQEVIDEAVPITYTTAAGVLLSFRVMHPVHVLRSRVHNVLAHEKYRSPHGRGQLRASLVCAREFLTDLSARDVRRTLFWNERLFEFRTSDAGKKIATDYGVDVFDVLYVGPGLPQAFYDQRYPRMLAIVAALRQAAAKP